MSRNALTAAAAFAVLTFPASAGPDASSLAGVYKHPVPYEEFGEKVPNNEDILEIVPYGPAKDGRAYFRLKMLFAAFSPCDASTALPGRCRMVSSTTPRSAATPAA